MSYIFVSSNNPLVEGTTACVCGKSIEDCFLARDSHTQVVLRKQKLNFQKTAVWILIVLNSSRILLECFVAMHEHFQKLSLHLWIRKLNEKIVSFDRKQCERTFISSNSAFSIFH